MTHGFPTRGTAGISGKGERNRRLACAPIAGFSAKRVEDPAAAGQCCGLRGDEGPEPDHHDGSWPASDVGCPAFPFRRSEQMADQRRSGHDGLWPARRNRGADGQPRRAGCRYCGGCIDPDEYPGTWHGHPISLRSEEHTSELQSLMRKSYADFCLKKKKKIATYNIQTRRYDEDSMYGRLDFV